MGKNPIEDTIDIIEADNNDNTIDVITAETNNDELGNDIIQYDNALFNYTMNTETQIEPLYETLPHIQPNVIEAISILYDNMVFTDGQDIHDYAVDEITTICSVIASPEEINQIITAFAELNY